jgi:hypothetical protein
MTLIEKLIHKVEQQVEKKMHKNGNAPQSNVRLDLISISYPATTLSPSLSYFPSKYASNKLRVLHRNLITEEGQVAVG